MNLFELIKDFKEIHLSIMHDSNKPSCFLEARNYQLLKVRGLQFSNNELSHHATNFIFFEKKIYLYDQKDKTLAPLHDSYTSMLLMLHDIYAHNNLIIDQYLNHIDSLEEKIYDREINSSFIDSWFDFKKDLSKVERYLKRNILALENFWEFFESSAPAVSVDFEHLLHNRHTAHKSVLAYLDRLDAIYNYYMSIRNDKLNKNIYFLTVVSAIFLPLNLIVGFFGMNTTNLFFAQSHNGTIAVLIILASVSFLLIAGFKILKLLDLWVLRQLFHKSSLYKKLIDRLTHLST